MEKVLVVGSGASGVHFALSVLNKGYSVVMVDVGYGRLHRDHPVETFRALKTELSDPIEFFLGNNYEAVVFPGLQLEYYAFPPNKNYVFSRPDRFEYEAKGFAPLLSFGRGGLAEAWTAGVYPFNERDLQPFPFSFQDIEPFYAEVARRIGICGTNDDLARFYPLHDHLMEPLKLDQHSEKLMSAYQRNKSYLNRELKCYLGRSRIATLTADLEDRKACTYLGRCLWGCPTESLYTPSVTLRHCMKYANFQYLPGMFVSHFNLKSERIKSAVAITISGNEEHEIEADRFVLAAGTLSSSKIFMESIRRATGEIVVLPGLMDNRQILIPFVNLRMIGEKYNPDNYQYHQLSMGIELEKPAEYLHSMITTLKSALVHPMIQSVPLDLRTALAIFKNVRSSLGLINLNFPDTRRPTNFLTLQKNGKMENTRLAVCYCPVEGEDTVLKRAIQVVKRALWKMDCIVPPGMIHVRPMGASVHYAGTIPMSDKSAPLTSSVDCRSHDFENLHFVDGTTFPSLPAKNLTFTLMANAIRVAQKEF